MIRRILALCALMTLAAATAVQAAPQKSTPAAFGAYKPAAAYDSSVTEAFYVPMRDGTKIAMRLVRPAIGGKAAPGKFPVIWHATLDIAPTGFLPNLAKQGYVVALVARRGNGASFGVRRGYEDLTESFDHYELIEWLAAQSWSTGKVGMYGCSNTGEAVMHALKMRPPHLAAAFSGCFALDRFDGHVRGAIVANYGTGPQRTVEEDMRANPVDADTGKTMLHQAAEEHLRSTDLFAMMKGMPYRDSWSPLVMSKFWSESSVAEQIDMVRRSGVPLYIQGGWYDDFRAQAFVTLANLPGQARVIIGPWRHCRYGDFDITSEVLRFFDHHLKGLKTGIETDAPIHYFTVGAPAGHEWKAATQWPLPGVKSADLYLTGGRLAAQANPAQPLAFKADYAEQCPPDPQGGGPFTQPCHPKASARFTGETMARDTELTGHPIAVLWIASSREDAHVFAYLEDVAPDGTLTMLSEGRQKASLRKLSQPRWNNAGLPWRRGYAEDEQLLKAGEPVEVVFDLLPVSFVVKAGHRLQVSVSGSDPRERLRMSGEAPTISVFSDSAHRSKISLPVAP